MMNGLVRIRLASSDGRISSVQISCERPDVTPCLRGQTKAAVLQRISLLYALCGKVQLRAATLALTAATGEERSSIIDSEVEREAMREHLWHCLIVMPGLSGKTPQNDEFVRAAIWIAEGQRAELYEWLKSADLTRVPLDEAFVVNPLPQLDAKSSLEEWSHLTEIFCRYPTWRGIPAETPAISTIKGTHARFDILLSWASGEEPRGGMVSSVNVAPGVGRALVETARGMLMHEVELDGDRVADYRIVAPTEWNFHPEGALAKYLMGQPADDRGELNSKIARLVAELDPCVPWELEWL
jgi:coenzyme F420-reducing hydrogenase alpha subunit